MAFYEAEQSVSLSSLEQDNLFLDRNLQLPVRISPKFGIPKSLFRWVLSILWFFSIKHFWFWKRKVVGWFIVRVKKGVSGSMMGQATLCMDANFLCSVLFWIFYLSRNSAYLTTLKPILCGTYFRKRKDLLDLWNLCPTDFTGNWACCIVNLLF